MDPNLQELHDEAMAEQLQEEEDAEIAAELQAKLEAEAENQQTQLKVQFNTPAANKSKLKEITSWSKPETPTRLKLTWDV